MKKLSLSFQSRYSIPKPVANYLLPARQLKNAHTSPNTGEKDTHDSTNIFLLLLLLLKLFFFVTIPIAISIIIAAHLQLWPPGSGLVGHLHLAVMSQGEETQALARDLTLVACGCLLLRRRI